MTDKELKSEYLAYWETIHRVGCYGTRDMVWLDSLGRELVERGYEILEGEPQFYKSGGEEEYEE